MKTSIKVSKELETIIQTERKLIDDIYCNRGVWNTSKKGAG